MNTKNSKYVGQYTACALMDGSYMICRILDIYPPGITVPFERHNYTNDSDHVKFLLEGNWISVPDMFFESKEEAELWVLNKKCELIQKELEKEREAHTNTRRKLINLRRVIKEASEL